MTEDCDDFLARNRRTPPQSECIHNALRDADALSVLSTSFPFAAMVTKRRWCAFCFVRVLYHFSFLVFYRSPSGDDFYRGHFFRLKIEYNTSEEVYCARSLAYVGLLRHGIEHLAEKRLWDDNSSIIVEFAKSVEVDSWYFSNQTNQPSSWRDLIMVWTGK